MEAEKTLIRFYKITSELGNMIYTGSTKKTIDERFETHEGLYKIWKKGETNKTMSFDLFDKYGIEHCKITELSNQICNKQQRNETEAGYILQFRQDINYTCTNKVLPGRTGKQYRDENKDKMKEYQSHYQVANAQKMKEYQSQYRDDRRQEINERNKHKCVCEKCGLEYPPQNKNQHEKSKKHIHYITINITNNFHNTTKN